MTNPRLRTFALTARGTSSVGQLGAVTGGGAAARHDPIRVA